MGFEIEAEAVENRRDDFSRFDWSFDWISADFIAFADDASAFHSASGEGNGPALRPMIAAAGRIDLWRTAKLSEGSDECAVEHAALEKIFEEGAVALIVHRRDDLFHTFDGSERLGTVDVPRDFIEDRDESVYGNEADAGFD